MLLMSFFTWWYGPGWFSNITHSKSHLANFSKNFSVGILLRTLFAPWKQIYSTGPSNETAINKFLDRLISRLVGFVVRSMTLFIALFGLVFIILFQLIWFLIWPLLPLLVIATFLYGVGVI